MKKLKLEQEEKEFLSLLTEVIFSNPFSFERGALEKRLGLKPRTTEHSVTEHHYIDVIPVLKQNLAHLEQKGIDNIQLLDAF